MLIAKLKYHLLLVLILVSLVVLAVIARGGRAWDGITWGVDLSRGGILATACRSDVVKSLLGKICEVDIKDLTANFGVYDFGEPKKFAQSDRFAIEHVFIQWNDYQPADFKGELSEIIKRSRWPLVTIEPYALDNLVRETILNDVAAGKYDQQILNVCGDIQALNHPVFIRWGHEMENVTGRYPWATDKPQEYINAYRYFVERCRGVLDQVYFVWSPVGDQGLEKYWPGNEFVDYVGVSVYAYSDWEQDYHGRTRPFAEIFAEKYDRVKDFDRPVMVAELGVTGGADFQKKWMAAAFRSLADYPELKTIVYFNAPDTEGVWGENYATPDWSIDPDAFEL